MTAAPYLDSSALAKWYLNEPRSEDFEAFIAEQSSGMIGRLTGLEFRCLLARRRRAGDIDDREERRILDSFESDIRAGFLEAIPLEDRHVLLAVDLLARLRRHPLRTLDALHLAVAQAAATTTLATADRVMAGAGQALGFSVARFD